MPCQDSVLSTGSRVNVQASDRSGELALILTDSGSQNGTYVDDQRLPAHQPHRLHDGDVVGFGIPLSAAASLMDELVTQHVRPYSHTVCHGCARTGPCSQQLFMLDGPFAPWT